MPNTNNTICYIIWYATNHGIMVLPKVVYASYSTPVILTVSETPSSDPGVWVSSKVTMYLGVRDASNANELTLSVG